jgi:choline transport protein
VSIALNIIGLIFLLFAAITFNFPSENPVTHQSMNYTSAAIGVIALISGITWITTGRKQFSGPGAVNISSGENTATQNVAGTDAQHVDEKRT